MPGCRLYMPVRGKATLVKGIPCDDTVITVYKNTQVSAKGQAGLLAIRSAKANKAYAPREQNKFAVQTVVCAMNRAVGNVGTEV